MRTFSEIDFASGRGDHVANEDLVGWAGPFAWVMDGASSIGAKPWIDQVSDARWLVAQYDEAMRSLANPGISCLDLMRSAITEVSSRVNVASDENLMPNLALGILKLEEEGVSYFGLGDTTICFMEADGSVITPLDGAESNYDGTASQEIQDLLVAGWSIANATTFVYERMLEDRHRYMNQPGGYWTVSTVPEAVEHGAFGFLEVDVSEVFLMTDGFRRFVDTYHLGATMCDSLHDWVASGLKRALAQIREVEDGDPEMRKFPRISRRDDATCARLSAIDAIHSSAEHESD